LAKLPHKGVITPSATRSSKRSILLDTPRQSAGKGQDKGTFSIMLNSPLINYQLFPSLYLAKS